MTVKAIPEGYTTITPYFAVDGAKKLLDFLKAAFGAEVKGISENNGVIFNAEVRIGTGMLMLADTRGQRPGNKAMMYLYVNDCDKVYAQAVKAGGKSVLAPMDHDYGDRSGAVEDEFGNQWWIATHIRDVTPAELAKIMQKKQGNG